MDFIRFMGGSLSDKDQKKLDMLTRKNKIMSTGRKALSTLLIFLFFILSVLVSIFFLDIKMNDYPIFKIEKMDEILYSLLQVQATVVTLSIAVVSLITGIMQKRICGIYLSKYIMFEKNKVLSNYRLILISFMMVLINCLLVILGYKMTSIFIVFISIIIIYKIINNIFYIFRKPNALNQEITDYFLKNIKSNCEKINRIEFSEKNMTLDYYLQKKPSIIPCHQNVELYLTDWYENIATKMNERSFNDYAPCIKLIYRMYFSFDLAHANDITIYSLDLFSQYRDEISHRLIKNQEFDLAFYTTELTAGFLSTLYFNDNEVTTDLKKLAPYFNCYSQIHSLILNIPLQYKFEFYFIYQLMNSLFAFSKYVSVYIYSYLDDVENAPKDLTKLLPDLFVLLFYAIKNNKHFSKDEKNRAYGIFRSFLSYQNNEKNYSCELVPSGWQNFMQYKLHIHSNQLRMQVPDNEKSKLLRIKLDQIKVDMGNLFVNILVDI